jgi:hypothetical protein
MSTERSLTDDRVSVQTDGIGVLKEFKPAEFSVPVIRYVIVSNRGETVSIRLSDDVPEDFPMKGIRFHPEYEKDNWSKNGSQEIAFECTIDPGEEVETIYAVQVTDPAEVEAFLSGPEIAQIRPEQTDLELDSETETVDGTTVDEVDAGDAEEMENLIPGDSSDATDRNDDQRTDSATSLDGSSSGSTGNADQAEGESDVGLDTDINFDDVDTDVDFDGIDDNEFSSDGSENDDFSIDLDGTPDSMLDTDHHDRTAETGWDASQSTSGGLSGLTTGSDSDVTVEVDWTDLPPHLRKELVQEMTSDIEFSIPLEKIVKEAVKQRVDALFESIDEESLQEAIQAGLSDNTDDGATLGPPTPNGRGIDTQSNAADEIDSITLIINGERYSFEDGETFGRRDEPWLRDLIEAAGDEDHVSYISSHHVEFSIEDGDAYVEDVSRNGTSLNNTDLDGDKERLTDGDVLRLAGVVAVGVKLDDR